MEALGILIRGELLPRPDAPAADGASPRRRASLAGAEKLTLAAPRHPPQEEVVSGTPRPRPFDCAQAVPGFALCTPFFCALPAEQFRP
jgi:hypothetical protein